MTFAVGRTWVDRSNTSLWGAGCVFRGVMPDQPNRGVHAATPKSTGGDFDSEFVGALELHFFSFCKDGRSAFRTVNVRSYEWGQIDVATRELTVRAIDTSDLPPDQGDTIPNLIVECHK